MRLFSADDHRFMAEAIRQAQRGRYTTRPNPNVGCVIVRQQEVVGVGWHEYAGEPHAEVHALKEAGPKAQGATAYVSLEPCSHYGRTPPCADALIKAGITRVVAAMQDPNPTVTGRGIQRLKQAGIDVSTGLMEAEALTLNKGFVKRMRSGQPFVRVKLAMSLDGRTAMDSGESKWITGADARSDVQKLRAASCAIITGVHSVIQDNPSLTLRAPELPLPNAALICNKQPLRVILDSQLKTPPSAKIISAPGSCLIVTTANADPQLKLALELAGAEVYVQTNRRSSICLSQLIDMLGKRGCNNVLFETGPTLAGAVLQENLLDEAIIYMAPVIMGSSAKPLFHLPLSTMAEKKPLAISDIRSVGSDWRITATPK